MSEEMYGDRFFIDGPFVTPKTLSYYKDNINITGWAIVLDPTCRLACYVGKVFVGVVIPSGIRNDVLQAYPWLPDDYRAGFNTTVRFNSAEIPNPSQQLVRLVIERDGHELLSAEFALVLGTPRSELHLDEVTRNGEGHIVCDQKNMRLSGWAVAEETIDGITIKLGNDIVRGVHYGTIRPDVLAIHPENPNGAAVGFSCFFDEIPLECDSLELLIQLRNGVSATQRFDISVRADTVVLSEFRRPSFAELHLLRQEASLCPSRSQCCFIVTPSPGGPAEGLANEHEATIVSIGAAAATAGWDIHLLAFHRCSHADASLPYETFDTTADLARALIGRIGQWAIFLAPGDSVSPTLLLFLGRAEYAGRRFVYWDEVVLHSGQQRTVRKIPGAPFVTELHHDVAGRGWAVRIDHELLTVIAAAGDELAPAVLALHALIRPESCVHIPEVLSRHCTQLRSEVDEQCDIASRNMALTACRSLFGQVSLAAEGTGRRLSLHPIRKTWPRISVIIPTIGTQARVIKCLEGLRFSTEYSNLEVVVIDHIPFRPEYLDLKLQVRDLADAVLPMIGEYNWSRFNNLGAALATGEVLLFLNDDIEVRRPDWLHRLLPYLSLSRVGAVGPSLLTADSTVQSCGVSLVPGEGFARNDFAFTNLSVPLAGGVNQVPHNCTSLQGAAIMTRRETFEAIGGFDEELPVTFNDLDYHMKLRDRGLDVVVVPTATLVHHEKTSRFLIKENVTTQVPRGG